MAGALGAGGCRTERSIEELTAQMPAAEGSGQPGNEAAADGGWQRLVRRFADDLTPISTERWVLANGPTLDHRFVPPSDGDVPRCMTWLAASWQPQTDSAAASSAPDGPDIDLLVYDPDGNVVAADVGTDNFPVIARWCPTQLAPHTARVRLSAQATARVQLGGFVHPPASDAREAASASLLASVAARLPQAQLDGAVRHVSLPALADAPLVVPILPGTCVAVAAWGYAPAAAPSDAGPAAPIVDLVVQEVGDPPRADLGETNTPLLPALCAPAQGDGVRLRVLLRARHDAADIVWAAFLVPAPT